MNAVAVGAPVRRAPLHLLLLTLVAGFLLTSLPARASTASTFPGLVAGQRVYDTTETSLTGAQFADLGLRLDRLQRETGAAAVVFVRAQDATPEDTLEQVEALQPAWAMVNRSDPSTSVAILINRNPDDRNDARAGIFVGATYDEGKVPRGEQEAIVEDELIPALRDGDVYASLTAAIDRLGSSIVNDPPAGAFADFAAGATWLPWTLLAAAMLGAAGALRLYGRRDTFDSAATGVRPPTTIRPGELSPALAGALVGGGPQISALPAVILELATRGALTIEQEKAPGRMSAGTVHIRLLDRAAVRDDIEANVWRELEERADGGLVSSKKLAGLAMGTKDVRRSVEAQLNGHGWLHPDSRRPRAALAGIGTAAAGLLILGFVFLAFGSGLLTWVSVVAAALLSIAAFTMAGTFSRLSRAGQEAAVPWKAYRDGLKRAAKDEHAYLDLDASLPDVVALNLGDRMDKRLKQATESGTGLRAFASGAQPTDSSGASVIATWGAFSGVFTSSSGAGAVSGGGASSGGGAAGST